MTKGRLWLFVYLAYGKKARVRWTVGVEEQG